MQYVIEEKLVWPAMSPALVRLDSALDACHKLLGEAGADLGWAADAATLLSAPIAALRTVVRT